MISLPLIMKIVIFVAFADIHEASMSIPMMIPSEAVNQKAYFLPIILIPSGKGAKRPSRFVRGSVA